MTLNNFEKEARKKLGAREMTPAKRAWEEVSASLDEINRPARKPYFWYGIAASFIGVIIISVFYFSQAKQLETGVQIVETPRDVIKEAQTIGNKEQNELHNAQPKKPENAVVAINPLVIEEKSKQQPQNNIVVASVDRTKDETIALKITPAPSEEIIDTKLQEIIAQVDLLEKGKESLTDVEVDSLLRQAQREILSEKLFQDDRSVDATALLNEVEDELDQSFRDQIFEKLKTGFIKVRTAVADRNN